MRGKGTSCIFVIATCGLTPNASLHLWRRCRRQVLQFYIFQRASPDGGFSPVPGLRLCLIHSEKSDRDRGCRDRRLSIQTYLQLLPVLLREAWVLLTRFTVLNANKIAKPRGVNQSAPSASTMSRICCAPFRCTKLTQLTNCQNVIDFDPISLGVNNRSAKSAALTVKHPLQSSNLYSPTLSYLYTRLSTGQQSHQIIKSERRTDYMAIISRHQTTP